MDQIKDHPLGRDWPIVYIIENNREVYIGETTSALNRSKQHFLNNERIRLNKIHLILDEEFNKSATLDLESQLIQYFSAEGSLKLQNGNNGLENHNYFDKERYRAKLETIWEQLQRMSIVRKNLEDIENSELFKYSPYKALTEDQLRVVNDLYESIIGGETATHIVNGGPGTGKTILATYLVKRLKEDERTKNLSIGLVVPMTSLRKSIKNVFSRIGGLSSGMVLGPGDVARQKFDLLIVDETHRLHQRRGITNYRAHDETNRLLGFGKNGTELDWILSQSKQQILFYDENQSIRPSDVRQVRFKDLRAKQHQLTNQVRVRGGEKYIEFIDALFKGERGLNSTFENFDFQIFEDVSEMVEAIKKKEKKFGLCRVVAGFAWPWISRENHNLFDIEIEGTKLRWNATTANWINSSNAINEVGCIHTVQGYDLNYVGVIVGPELTCDVSNDHLAINPDKYEDRNGWRGVEDPEELERYIINIYKTLMTRGMRGCYLYFVDKKTEAYFKARLSKIPAVDLNHSIASSINFGMIQVPLVGAVPCGNQLLGEENIEEYIPVPKKKLRPDVKYFIVRAQGDSMNLAGIENGDLLLCRHGEKGETGDKVIALLGGENVTVKEYGPRKNGMRLLLPKSTNKKHKPITPGEGDSVQGIVQEVLK